MRILTSGSCLSGCLRIEWNHPSPWVLWRIIARTLQYSPGNYLSTECSLFQGDVRINLLTRRILKWICNASCSVFSTLIRTCLVIRMVRFETIERISDHDSNAGIHYIWELHNYIIAALSVTHIKKPPNSNNSRKF